MVSGIFPLGELEIKIKIAYSQLVKFDYVTDN